MSGAQQGYWTGGAVFSVSLTSDKTRWEWLQDTYDYNYSDFDQFYLLKSKDGTNL